ncbi:hypothetical protein DSO57_1001422 [Entomophthora muscae]|uniref:Uncharacterized protein n=1 Tax=Entomophthora muscae TaxID=34485 RepID=A0ACC2TJW9_9FUNG|nr:hypothetical protein DSO57_1001422 [Entomophthora muscae]
MQAKYKLQASHLSLLGNEKFFQLVPGFDPEHTMGAGEQEPHRRLDWEGSLLLAPSDLLVINTIIVMEEALLMEKQLFSQVKINWLIDVALKPSVHRAYI